MSATSDRPLRGAELRQQLADQHGARCVWCSRPLTPDSAGCTLEHVIPCRSGGKALGPANLVLACQRCNHDRGRLGPGDWIAFCESRGMTPNRRLIASILAHYGADAPPHSLARAYARDQAARLRATSRAPWGAITGTATAATRAIVGAKPPDPCRHARATAAIARRLKVRHDPRHRVPPAGYRIAVARSAAT